MSIDEIVFRTFNRGMAKVYNPALLDVFHREGGPSALYAYLEDGTVDFGYFNKEGLMVYFDTLLEAVTSYQENMLS